MQVVSHDANLDDGGNPPASGAHLGSSTADKVLAIRTRSTDASSMASKRHTLLCAYKQRATPVRVSLQRGLAVLPYLNKHYTSGVNIMWHARHMLKLQSCIVGKLIGALSALLWLVSEHACARARTAGACTHIA